MLIVYKHKPNIIRSQTALVRLLLFITKLTKSVRIHIVPRQAPYLKQKIIYKNQTQHFAESDELQYKLVSSYYHSGSGHLVLIKNKQFKKPKPLNKKKPARMMSKLP